jgi:hypothetical protein
LRELKKMGDVLDEDLFPLTIDDMIGEARREIEVRERVFPRWVQAGKITGSEANRRIRLMKKIGATLERVKHTGEVET